MTQSERLPSLQQELSGYSLMMDRFHGAQEANMRRMLREGVHPHQVELFFNIRIKGAFPADQEIIDVLYDPEAHRLLPVQWRESPIPQVAH